MKVTKSLFHLFLRGLLCCIALLGLILFAFYWAASMRETQALGTIPEQGGRLIQTSEGEIYVLERGELDNQPVLFAHGTAAWSGLWLPTLEAVSRNGYRAIGYDLPPFGFSAHPKDDDYSRQKQADRILALVNSLGVKPIVVAHSFGAGPVAEAVLRDPNAFAGLIIVAGAIGVNSHLNPTNVPRVLKGSRTRKLLVAATASNPMLTKVLLRNLIHVKDAASAEVVKTLQQPMTREGYTSAVNKWVPSLLASPHDALSTSPINWQSLVMPTVLIWGDKDTVTPLSQGEELSELINGASLEVLSEVGHIPQIEAFEEFRSTFVQALVGMSP